MAGSSIFEVLGFWLLVLGRRTHLIHKKASSGVGSTLSFAHSRWNHRSQSSHWFICSVSSSGSWHNVHAPFLLSTKKSFLVVVFMGAVVVALLDTVVAVWLVVSCFVAISPVSLRGFRVPLMSSAGSLDEMLCSGSAVRCNTVRVQDTIIHQLLFLHRADHAIGSRTNLLGLRYVFARLESSKRFGN